jgi:hypothetical protein
MPTRTTIAALWLVAAVAVSGAQAPPARTGAAAPPDLTGSWERVGAGTIGGGQGTDPRNPTPVPPPP